MLFIAEPIKPAGTTHCCCILCNKRPQPPSSTTVTALQESSRLSVLRLLGQSVLWAGQLLSVKLLQSRHSPYCVRQSNVFPLKFMFTQLGLSLGALTNTPRHHELRVSFYILSTAMCCLITGTRASNYGSKPRAEHFLHIKIFFKN